MSISAKERHVMEHACAFRHTHRYYRNSFVAGPDNDDWGTLQELCRRGLMRTLASGMKRNPEGVLVFGEPSDFLGGMSCFSVTDEGKRLLEAMEQ